MKTLKEIEKMFPDSFRSDNWQHLFIKNCHVGNGIYDYGEEEKPINFKSEYLFLKNDPRIIILTCDNCCECGGW